MATQGDSIEQAPDPARLALRGLRVLEIGTGPALAYTGKLFADFGAEVVKVEALGADAWERMPPLLDGPEPRSALWAWLHTNKRSVTADPAQDAAWLQQLAQTCDVVLDARALDEGLAVLERPIAGAQPVPVEIVFTWFGEDGPYSHYAGSEAVCRALSGAVFNSGPVEGPPHMPHELQAGIAAGLVAFSAAVAAWTGRADGSRRYVLSVHEAVFGTVEMEAGMVQDGRHAPRLGVNRFCGTHPTGIYATAQGWIGIFTHTLAQWGALCEAIGRPELAQDPRYANGAERMARADEIDAMLRAALLTRTAQAWFEELGARKHPTVLVPTMAELLAQDVHRGRHAFVPVTAGAARCEGPTVPLRLGAAGPLRGGAAPTRGADDAHYRGAGLLRMPTRAAGTAQRLPLAGITIVDLTMGWAGPLAARTAADLGAEVIKVESAVYPDWWRGANFTEEFYRERLYEKNSNFNLMNRNKRGITLDLARAEGRQLLLQLVAQADAVIENYSAEVLPKLGLDDAALRAVNERLVMVSMPAFGIGNAWSDTRAYGGTLEQATGLPLYTGHADGPPAMTSYAYGDPVGGLNAGAALLLALHVQRETGRGMQLNLSQVEAMLPMAAPFVLAQSVHGAVPPRTGNSHPLHAPHGCWRCAGPDDWIVVSVRDDGQWQALCSVLDRPDLASDAGLAQAQGRLAQQGRLDTAMAAWAAARGADAAMQQLQQAGVSAGVVRSIPRLMDDPHLHARGFWQRLERAHVGAYLSGSTPFRADGRPLPIRQVAPTLGEHTAQVLGERLGLTAAQLDALEQQGITGRSARPRTGRAAA
ncbi:CaiB/BaiF CoA-transferase family protein [Pseudorhodoferax soli]|uniref:Crotonobetainyl-CoA:carnitine CoA-transferase CaiB-like acyl-CoA transferase n=1 Tax=Pseudorhodoferax soli TaxID=545864 RepID=A0A368XLT5_9BURK|nr:CoA transferase [Pseudorhodoferax soli]RCW68815.1 crotonobetainyl-CoA:carnitine CoA-transferase CaiB-like acyl-CoA transferase [Pseudorhodoferax soli]